MADMGTKEASEKWGVSQATVQKWCREGKIKPQPTQDKRGSSWHISKNATPPLKKIITNGGIKMGEVVSYPVVCPYCDKIMDKYDWKKISEGYEQSTGSNYSMSKGIVGGLLGLGTHMGFAHSKGDSKGKRLDNYQCRHCKAMIQIEVHTFW